MTSYERRKLRALLLGSRPELSTLKVQLKARTDCKSYVREKVTFRYPGEEPIHAYVLIPKRAPLPAPAVLCPHPHGMRWELGKESVVKHHADLDWAYALDLVEEGFVALAPDAKCFGERQLKKLDAEQMGWGERYEAMQELLYGRSLARRHLRDLRTAVDYLTTRKDVDSRRIGCMGFSMGAGHTFMLAALERRIRCSVACCGVSTYKALLKHQILHAFFYYVPGLLPSFDMPRILSLIPPRPFMILNGRYDSSLPLEGLREVTRSLKPLYSARGVPERFTVHVGPYEHEFCEDFQQRAYGWLRRWLMEGTKK